MISLSLSKTVNASALASWSRSAAVLLAIFTLSGCGQKDAQTASAGAPAAGAGASGGSGGSGGGGGGGGRRGGAGGPAPVLVAQAHRKVVPLLVDAIGAVEPMRSASIRSQVAGVVTKIAIKEGQDVKEGDLLIQIDQRPFQNALRSAEADREKIAVQLENARTQVARYRTLSNDAMVSKEQFQQYQDNERALTAQSLSSDAAVANAKLQLEYSAIRAPISGRTGNLNVHEGDLVRANDTGFLVAINQLSPIYVTFGVPQQHLAAINRYRAAHTLKVNVTPPGTDETPESGELTFVDNIVDSTTGTLKLKATFPNDSQRLWPGQFADVNLTLTAPEVLVVPSSAVQTSQTGQFVYVVNAEKNAEVRAVTIERNLDSDAVVTKGLNDGDTVVIDGQLRVIPGKPVDIKQPDILTNGGGGGRRGEGGKGGGKGKKDGAKDGKDAGAAAKQDKPKEP